MKRYAMLLGAFAMMAVAPPASAQSLPRTLVELFAQEADTLSAYQDAIYEEAYIDTASGRNRLDLQPCAMRPLPVSTTS